MKFAFNNLRNRAKERGHEFTLTFADYEAFAIQTGYDKLKGKTKHSLSIDRRDPERGYHRDNIRAVSLSLNSRLRFANLPGWLRDEMIEAERKSFPDYMRSREAELNAKRAAAILSANELN